MSDMPQPNELSVIVLEEESATGNRNSIENKVTDDSYIKHKDEKESFVTPGFYTHRETGKIIKVEIGDVVDGVVSLYNPNAEALELLYGGETKNKYCTDRDIANLLHYHFSIEKPSQRDLRKSILVSELKANYDLNNENRFPEGDKPAGKYLFKKLEEEEDGSGNDDKSLESRGVRFQTADAIILELRYLAKNDWDKVEELKSSVENDRITVRAHYEKAKKGITDQDVNSSTPFKYQEEIRRLSKHYSGLVQQIVNDIVFNHEMVPQPFIQAFKKVYEAEQNRPY